jgi:A/G-specific adenine glycosylase
MTAPADDLDALRAALLRWYARARRDLPWRRTTDPYAILVSEVMLQQTQVARVVPRYLEWLERWPTAAALAAASRAEVLAAWVGLGYNRRALALHAAATVVASDGWPDDLETLPGVGAYTAAAVASFAFGAQVAAVDTNTRRVAERLGRGEPAALLPAGRAAEWNQAAMELGATVCTARVPRCDECPVAAWCAAAAAAAAGRPGGGAAVTAGRGAAVAAGGAAVVAAGGPARGEPRRGRGGGRRPAERFEDTNRFVRGRVVAALAAGEGLPRDIAPERLERAVAGLVRDGLVRPVEGGFSLG